MYVLSVCIYVCMVYVYVLRMLGVGMCIWCVHSCVYGTYVRMYVCRTICVCECVCGRRVK